MMENPRPEEENIIKGIKNLFILENELNYTVIKHIRKLFRLQKETKVIKDIKNLFSMKKKKIVMNQLE